MKIKKYLITYEKFDKGVTQFRYYDEHGNTIYKHQFLFYSIREARKLFIELLKTKL
jgi:hypothetical protein